MSNLGDVLSKLVYLNLSQTGVCNNYGEPPAASGYGGLGAKPQPQGDFCKFLEKKSILIPLDHISHVFRAIWKN